MRTLSLFVVAPLLLWLGLFVSWQTLSGVNFAYPTLYDAMSLDETIATYGPTNLYKNDFHLTSDDERFRIFAEIVKGINNHGQGLEGISYHGPQGVIDRLLRAPEVVHLQDVANLIDRLRVLTWGVISAIVVLGLFVLLKGYSQSFSVMKVYLLTVSACLALSVVLFLFGAESIFYYMHTVVFPEGHQWFFYYEESLMTTMMRAPDLFAGIAVLLVILALVYFYVFLKLTSMLLAANAKRSASL